MRVLFLILFSTIFLLLASSQEPKRLKQLIFSNNYPGFSLYIDSLNLVNRSGWRVEVDEIRPLTGDASSRFLRISELTEYNGPGNINNHIIRLLINKNEIVYCRLETNYFQHEGERLRSMNLTDSFKEVATYNKIFRDYQHLYQVPLETAELWSDEIVYGWSCGIGGGLTEQAEKVTGFVNNNQIDSIRQWLRSPIPAKQLYAVKAFRKIGLIHLTKQDKRIINALSEKNASVAICNGCLISSKPIKEVLKDIYPLQSTKTVVYLFTGVGLFALIIFLVIRKRRATGGLSQV